MCPKDLGGRVRGVVTAANAEGPSQSHDNLFAVTVCIARHFVGVAVARRVRGIARGKLSRREIRI